MNILELINKEKMYADAAKIYNTNESIVNYIPFLILFHFLYYYLILLISYCG